MLGSSGAFGWFFWVLWVLNLKMFLICGPPGLNKERRIYFRRAPGGDHFGADGLCLSEWSGWIYVWREDANLRRGREGGESERRLPGRQRRAVRAAERDLWPMAPGGHCQRDSLRRQGRVHEGRRFRAVDCRRHLIRLWVMVFSTQKKQILSSLYFS